LEEVPGLPRFILEITCEIAALRPRRPPAKMKAEPAGGTALQWSESDY
jgi:hypothetical protein